jgi:hypothetical protein
MLTAMVILAAVCTIGGPAKPHAFDAVFAELDGRDWNAFYQTNGGRDVIIANIFGYDADGCREGCDKTEEAVRAIAAAPNGTKVYAGLVYDATFDAPSVTDDFMLRAANEDVSLAKTLLRKLADHNVSKNISGWYLAREIYNFSDAKASRRMKTYYEKVSARLPPGERIIAPFFLPHTDFCGVLTAKQTAAMFKDVAGNANIRIMLQDGFGARAAHTACCKHWKALDYAAEAQEYEKALADVGEHWVIIETFGKDAGQTLNCQFEVLPTNAKTVRYDGEAPEPCPQ